MLNPLMLVRSRGLEPPLAKQNYTTRTMAPLVFLMYAIAVSLYTNKGSSSCAESFDAGAVERTRTSTCEAELHH